ncbi:MAG: hypothetical protein AAFR16_07330, partial [Pseudomonadota bacterium]
MLEASGLVRTALRIFFGALLVLAFLIFVLWRTDNPRLGALRLTVVDALSPLLEAVAGPSNALTRVFDDVQSFAELQAENAHLRQFAAQLRVLG